MCYRAPFRQYSQPVLYYFLIVQFYIYPAMYIIVMKTVYALVLVLINVFSLAAHGKSFNNLKDGDKAHSRGKREIDESYGKVSC